MLTVFKKLIKLVLVLLFVSSVQAQTKYNLTCSYELFEQSLRELYKLEGIQEATNRNDGKIINTIQKTCGIPAGSSYCAATQYYTFKSAADSLGLTSSGIPISRNGLAQAHFNYAKANGRQVRYFAEVGDLIVYKRGNTGFGHIGRVIIVGEMGWVYTIEGNVTSNNTKKQGIFRKKRNIAMPIDKILNIKGLVGFTKY